LEEDAVRDDNKVLMAVDAKSALIVGEPQGILLISWPWLMFKLLSYTFRQENKMLQKSFEFTLTKMKNHKF
jgi:hypothetical protein